MRRIKVFINGVGSSQSTADTLTKLCDDWLDENPHYEILKVRTDSNKYAWMITIQYEDHK